MSHDMHTAGHTIEESNGAWYRLWWEEGECVYSEELEARTRSDAELEGSLNASSCSPLQRIMDVLGCVRKQPQGTEVVSSADLRRGGT